jgi:hypothetical protein
MIGGLSKIARELDISPNKLKSDYLPRRDDIPARKGDRE